MGIYAQLVQQYQSVDERIVSLANGARKMDNHLQKDKFGSLYILDIKNNSNESKI